MFANILLEIFQKFAGNEGAIDVIALATSDGFAVQSLLQRDHNFESDTMAAAASTLYSVSNAVSQQVLSKEYKSTFIEAKDGNVCFVAFEYSGKDYVLAMSADSSMNIARLRMCINSLAEEIKNISL
ncbi:hypothetical protein TDB9533_04566 [Thalassocella blandensis]|nr:hypothetical protein TDB9533_04566 [Thalassocella blandensis]